jgi:preprotein translocase subunit SecB
VKDLSFENPNAPAVYQWQNQPQINVEFGISLAGSTRKSTRSA